MPRRLSTQEFIEKAKLVHRGLYDYSKVDYINSNIKITITCLLHGDFIQRPSSHLEGSGCIKCKHHKDRIRQRDTTEDFISKIKSVHEDRYDYSKVIYDGCYTPIVIICTTHGEFTQSPTSHMQGHGCPSCSAEMVSKRQLDNTIDFILKAKSIHGDRYDYSKVDYIHHKIKVIIICTIHGEFYQKPRVHLIGAGCRQCGSRHSKSCIDWLEQIARDENIFIQHEGNIGEYKIPNTRYKADGYCASTNTIYEFYGNYWHGNPSIYSPDVYNAFVYKTMGELYRLTIKREQRIKNLGYTMKTIWESDYTSSV